MDTGEMATRLRGYDFFRAIGSPQRIVAPMVRVSVFSAIGVAVQGRRRDPVGLLGVRRWTSRSWRSACCAGGTARSCATRQCCTAACSPRAPSTARRCLRSTSTTDRWSSRWVSSCCSFGVGIVWSTHAPVVAPSAVLRERPGDGTGGGEARGGSLRRRGPEPRLPAGRQAPLPVNG